MAKITIAVNGCSHGEFHNIFQTLKHIEDEEKIKIDALLCCGDFESIRPEPFPDLQSMACPEKYLKYGDFIDFYNAEEDSPLLNHPLTVFIGGNHESSHHLAELQYGGWVTRNIFFLGRCGALRLGYSYENSVSLLGLSGIYKSYDFNKGLIEKFPLSQTEKKTVYHIREWDLWRMELLKKIQDNQIERNELDDKIQRPSIGMSHEWPLNITEFEDMKIIEQELVRRQRKDHIMEDIRLKKLGCPAARKIFDMFQPTYWFSGHLHCDLGIVATHPDTGKLTKFLALDKVIPRRKFLQVLDIELPMEPKEGQSLSLYFDKDWLSVVKASHDITPTDSNFTPPANFEKQLFDAKEWVEKNLDETKIPTHYIKHKYEPSDPLFNPFTATLYRRLSLNMDILDRQMRRNFVQYSNSENRNQSYFNRGQFHNPSKQNMQGKTRDLSRGYHTPSEHRRYHNDNQRQFSRNHLPKAKSSSIAKGNQNPSQTTKSSKQSQESYNPETIEL